MITVWDAESKRVTPLIKPPVRSDESGHYRIPILKIEGNEKILIDMVDELIAAFDKFALYVHAGAPSRAFNRDTMRFTVNDDESIGVAYKAEVEDGVLYAYIQPTHSTILKHMLEGKAWLDVAVPYLAVVSNQQHYVSTWAKLIFIDIVPPSETIELQK